MAGPDMGGAAGAGAADAAGRSAGERADRTGQRAACDQCFLPRSAQRGSAACLGGAGDLCILGKRMLF